MSLSVADQDGGLSSELRDEGRGQSPWTEGRTFHKNSKRSPNAFINQPESA